MSERPSPERRPREWLWLCARLLAVGLWLAFWLPFFAVAALAAVGFGYVTDWLYRLACLGAAKRLVREARGG